MELASVQQENNNIERSFKWVKSHVDEIERREVTLEETINQQADELARKTIARKEAVDGLLPISRKQIFANAQVILSINNQIKVAS